MLTPLVVALQYYYQLILAPAFIIVLAVSMTLLLRYPVLKKAMGGALILAGLGEVTVSVTLPSVFGFIVGFGTFIIGIGVTIFAFLGRQKSAHPHLMAKKIAYVLLAIVILASAVLISLRATNVIREDHPEDFNYASTPNLTLRATVTSVALNYEVNTGYSYHIFPAYLTVDVAEVTWGSGPWANTTDATEHLQYEGSLVICCDKTDVPNFSVGQQIEASGYYLQWMEDSIYSGKFVIAPSISGSYLKVL